MLVLPLDRSIHNIITALNSPLISGRLSCVPHLHIPASITRPISCRPPGQYACIHASLCGMLQLVCHRWVASAKNKLWWMTPEWGTTASQLPPETQFLLIEVAAGGPYALFLPLIDSNTFRCTLRPETSARGGSTKLILRTESGDKAVQADHWYSRNAACLHLFNWAESQST